MREIIISAKEEGQRFDKFLGKYFKEASMGFLFKMLRKKNIVLNGKKATGKEMIQSGDSIKVFFADDTFDKMRGMNQSNGDFEALRKLEYPMIDVIYEDEDMLMVNKPAGVLSQKSSADDVSINEMILAYLIQSNQLTLEEYSVFHPSVANRLDRNTSGLLLAGKTLKGQQFLSEILKERNLVKIYHTIVVGKITKTSKIQGYLLKDETTNQVTIYDETIDGTLYIETEYTPILIGENFTYLKVHLITGRSHQIRAHLASIHHPIIGDTKYGDFKINQEMKRKYHLNHQLLHSYSMTLEDGREFVAPNPKIFDKILEDVIKG